jgi:hypothetical protein
MLEDHPSFHKEHALMFRKDNFDAQVDSFTSEGLWQLVGRYSQPMFQGKFNMEGIIFVMKVK